MSEMVRKVKLSTFCSDDDDDDDDDDGDDENDDGDDENDDDGDDENDDDDEERRRRRMMTTTSTAVPLIPELLPYILIDDVIITRSFLNKIEKLLPQQMWINFEKDRMHSYGRNSL